MCINPILSFVRVDHTVPRYFSFMMKFPSNVPLLKSLAFTGDSWSKWSEATDGFPQLDHKMLSCDKPNAIIIPKSSPFLWVVCLQNAMYHVLTKGQNRSCTKWLSQHVLTYYGSWSKKALWFESAVRAVESSFSKIPFLPFLRNLAFLHIEEFWSPIENLQAVQ